MYVPEADEVEKDINAGEEAPLKEIPFKYSAINLSNIQISELDVLLDALT